MQIALFVDDQKQLQMAQFQPRTQKPIHFQAMRHGLDFLPGARGRLAFIEGARVEDGRFITHALPLPLYVSVAPVQPNVHRGQRQWNVLGTAD
nr:hypothetical protein [Bordetella sp. FB-8]